MRKIFLTIITITLFLTTFGHDNDSTLLGSFQATLDYAQQFLFANISKTQFAKMNPSANYLKNEKKAKYNEATGKHDLYFYQYVYLTEYRNTDIEVRIEAVDENSPITHLEVVIKGAYWGGEIKEGEIKSDIYAQAAKGNFKSKGATKWGDGMNEFMNNDKVTVKVFYNLVNPKIVYEMWKHE